MQALPGPVADSAAPLITDAVKAGHKGAHQLNNAQVAHESSNRALATYVNTEAVRNEAHQLREYALGHGAPSTPQPIRAAFKHADKAMQYLDKQNKHNDAAEHSRIPGGPTVYRQLQKHDVKQASAEQKVNVIFECFPRCPSHT